ncbi:LysE family translocator [Saccharospirillum salsuginis]|uniref:Threonine transporter RhtB n=1 Tax=Saccharospirillum salsuginis TaxID=418750 RepID=A0A918K0V3_9GAMM|nr:LysE family translocator [Saccharospirillum salsuginis]GGX40171.1 threonine transporter RhtB [Saccharospirillum salsuginis]
MFDAQTMAFLAVAAALAITPGADTLLVIKNSVRAGSRAGWATTWGILAGVMAHALLSALGLSVILAQSDRLFFVIKSLGAVYLVWLGCKALWQSSRPLPHADPNSVQLPATAAFREGLLTNVLNPKVAIFYIAFLPQFISVGDPVLAKSILLASIHNGFSLIWLGGLVWALSRGQHWFQRSGVQKALARVSGTLLVGMGVKLFLTER